ncbi:MAG: ABC transporter substrate-binding protein [Planctomycetes bacterium]|nr:ABC transporter substrate-binding protein [Planctomycetota bacterium]
MTRSLPLACVLAVSLLAGGMVACQRLWEDSPAIRVVLWRPESPAAWQEAIDSFKAQHPGLEVVLEIGPNSSTALHDLLTQKLRNRDPSVDVFVMDVIWQTEFAAAGWTLPLDERFSPEEREQFFPAMIEALTWGGHVHGVPLNTDAGLLYYRKDLLDKHGLEPPRTWPEMVRQVERIEVAQADPALAGYSAQLSQYEGLVCNLLEFVVSNGGRLDDPQDPRTIAALRFVRDEIVGKAAPEGVLTYDEQASLDLFRSGRAIFHRNWPYAWKVLQDPSTSSVAGKVGLARLPAFEGHEPASCLGGWSLGVHAASRRPDMAWAFARHMTSETVQRLFAVREGKAPARRSLYDDPEVLRSNPAFSGLRQALESAVPRPRSPLYPQISRAIQRFGHEAVGDDDSDLEALAQKAARRIARAEERLR